MRKNHSIIWLKEAIEMKEKNFLNYIILTLLLLKCLSAIYSHDGVQVNWMALIYHPIEKKLE